MLQHLIFSIDNAIDLLMWSFLPFLPLFTPFCPYVVVSLFFSQEKSSDIGKIEGKLLPGIVIMMEGK